MEPTFFDDRMAQRYDESCGDRTEPAVLGPTVDLLAELAGDGRALELAVGTGRVALPLQRRGVEVHGIDNSAPMLAQLRSKPGGDGVALTEGDMVTTRVPGRFRLVFLVFSSITNLTTQDAQVACFANAAAHLEPGGRFLVEVGVPELTRLSPGERHLPFDVSPGHLGFDEYDLVEQHQVSYHYWVDGDEVTTFRSAHRYVWPAELDLMARLAGLTLTDRWSGWRREPFTATSSSHVSVWSKPA